MMVLRALQRTAPVRASCEILETHPLPTKCATSGALMVVSDVMRQKLEKRDADDAEPFHWDAARSSRLALWAVAFHAPYLHWLHPWYERACGSGTESGRRSSRSRSTRRSWPPVSVLFSHLLGARRGLGPRPTSSGAAPRALDR